MPSKNNESQTRFYLVALVCSLLTACGLYHYVTEMHARKETRLALVNAQERSLENYAGVSLHLNALSDYIHQELIARPELSVTVRELSNVTNPEDEAALREKLYQMTEATYERAKQAGVKQLHYHSSDLRSLLRMYRSEKHGDSLLGVRKTVELANREIRKVSSFEEGRIFNGYRFVYPLFVAEQHVGSLEISFSSGVVLNQLFQTQKSWKLGFVQPCEIVDAKVFEDERSNYVTSVFGESYVEEMDAFMTPFDHRYGDVWGDLPWEEILRQKFELASEVQHEASAVAFDLAGIENVMVYIPVLGVEEEVVAAIVGIAPSEVLDAIEDDRLAAHWLGGALCVLVLLLGSYFYRRIEGKNAETAEVNERLRLLADQVPGMLYQYRRSADDGIFSFPYVSEGVREVFELAPENVLHDASLLHARVHPDDRESVEASAIASSETLERWHEEFRLRYDDSRIEWVEGFATPQKQEDGSVLWHGYITKITGRKVREHDLAEARLSAEASEQAMAKFLARMSREIRTPMNSIIGLGDLLNTTELTSEQSQFVGNIIESGNVLLNTVSDILDFSQIEAEGLILVEKQFGLGGLLGKVLGIGESLGRARSVELVPHFSADLPEYGIGDESRIFQVVLNLVDNAIKFSAPNSRVEFYADVAYEDDENARVSFTVVDHGIGMSKEEQSRVFDPFLQPEKSSENSFKESGLGLVISHRLSKLMNGKLTFESAPGIGSRFKFEVPLLVVESNPEEESPEEESYQEIFDPVRDAGRANLNVLVVDDNPSNLHVAVMMLEKMGLGPACAENGQEAVAACLSEKYDLVIMDLEMPVMDGIRATTAIHDQIKPEDRPRIVALTANATEVQREVCFEVGMDDFLTKPIQMKKLEEVVATLARGKKRLVLN